MTPRAIVELVLRAAWNRGAYNWWGSLEEDMQKEVLADITDIVDERMREATYLAGAGAAMLADEVTARENELLSLLDDFATSHRRTYGLAGAYDPLLMRYRALIDKHSPEAV